MSTERITMTVTMEVTIPQALALREMFDLWNRFSKQGTSRFVGFMVDGDGNFKPKCECKFSEELPRLPKEIATRALVRIDPSGDTFFDFDPIAWFVNHGNPP